MKLSIVIVNYNVKYFIEQCLYSVYNALNGIEAEVFVVDNNSVDGSCAMIKEKFPQVFLIENKKNVGFSKANNQAIHISKGEYVLLLNPDTVVQEDTFLRCIEFMDEHPEAGALGVKMIDGKGNFLPESKRALPTPAVSFFKIFGFSRIFPKSKVFGRYHLGYLDNNQIHEIEVLAGAYMFMRRTALDKTGLLDEEFFMYGEDIDLSYRIVQAGYKNYYFPNTTIIHYKGESTKKGSLNYVMVFYNAMIIFARKHFSDKRFHLFALLIHFAIYFRAFLAIFKRFIKNIGLPLIDGLIIYIGFLFLEPFSERIKFDGTYEYPGYFLYFIIPVYVLIWILSNLLSGAYDKPFRMSRLIRGIGVGSAAILVVYALLPFEYHFSRLIIILGAIWAIFSLSTFRYALGLFGFKQFKSGTGARKKIVLVGDLVECERMRQLLMQTQIQPDIIGYVEVEENKHSEFLGTIDQLEDIISVYQVEEIIYSAKSLSSQEIIDLMLKLMHTQVEYKIAPPESLSIIGSNSINTAGDLYLINLNAINKPGNLREKRLFDLVASTFLLFLFPVLLFIVPKPISALQNIFKVLFGRLSWVGYCLPTVTHYHDLPHIKKGVLTPLDGLRKKNISTEMQLKLNLMYAKDYKVLNDFNILWRGLFNIGR